MLTEYPFPFNDDWKARLENRLVGIMRMNQYRANWPIVLHALRRLWETGKVSELKSPYYEPVEKPAIRW